MKFSNFLLLVILFLVVYELVHEGIVPTPHVAFISAPPEPAVAGNPGATPARPATNEPPPPPPTVHYATAAFYSKAVQEYGLGKNQILVELPGVDDPGRVRDLHRDDIQELSARGSRNTRWQMSRRSQSSPTR